MKWRDMCGPRPWAIWTIIVLLLVLVPPVIAFSVWWMFFWFEVLGL
jgi:hypothetical protein